MKMLTLTILLILSLNCNSQSVVKSNYTQAVNCKQKNGCETYGGDYQQHLYIKYDNITFQWTKSIYDSWVQGEVRKKTDRYVIALVNELYLFFDVTEKTLYHLDFVNDQYQTWGYGPDTEKVSANVGMIMQMLDEHKTQKDVMQFLIDQTVSNP